MGSGTVVFVDYRGFRMHLIAVFITVFVINNGRIREIKLIVIPIGIRVISQVKLGEEINRTGQHHASGKEQVLGLMNIQMDKIS